MRSCSLGYYLRHIPPLSSRNAKASETGMARITHLTISALSSYLWLNGDLASQFEPVTLNWLTVVIFQGYDVFTKGNAFWAIAAKPWSATLAPWTVLGVVVILFAIGCWISGVKGPQLSRERLFNGAVSRSPNVTISEPWIKRKVNRLLDNI